MKAARSSGKAKKDKNSKAQASKVKPPAKTSPVSSAPTPAETAQALAVAALMRGLSGTLEETARQYVRRLQREIFEIAEALPSRRSKEVAKAAKLLGSLAIKAQKGRRKDLKKIDLLIGELQQLVEG